MLPSSDWIASRLKLRHLRLLIAIENNGSLVKAAGDVAMSQPGATKALQEVEMAIGAPLFERTNRGLAPNELGQCVIRYARLVFQDLSHMRDEMASILDGHGGFLTVGTIMGAVPLLTDHLTSFLRQLPDVRVELIEDTSAHLLELLDNGKLELAICRTSVSSREDFYKSQRIWDEQLAVIANTNHPLAKKKDATLSQLASSRWIVCANNMPMRRYLEQEFHAQGLPFPRYYVETTSALAIFSLLQSNPEFVALLSVDVAAVLMKTGLTAILDMNLTSRSEPYYLVSRADRVLSPTAKLFIEQLTGTPGQEPPTPQQHVETALS